MYNTEELLQLRLKAARHLQKGDIESSHKILSLIKSIKRPIKNIDYLRGLTFLAMQQQDAAREAFKEELRYFPDNKQAKLILKELNKNCHIKLPDDIFFSELYTTILPFTMVGIQRVYALYHHGKQICQNGPHGNFVECGVAAGGTSGLLSAIIKKFAPERHLYSCDSFTGMPPVTSKDVCIDGTSAQDTGWGEGTCAAPESSVLELCEQLGTTHLITTIKGYFEDTLPLYAQSFGPIAFLHMDGDWYSSTKTILENLYEQLVPGAYIQVDDYGYWKGCQKAVHEFFEKCNIRITVHKIDSTGVYFFKNNVIHTNHDRPSE